MRHLLGKHIPAVNALHTYLGVLGEHRKLCHFR